uniref:BRCT domain-containing protein n=1 Tax=Romanomermis culicivorax TaxID=13658 RepID=A0A915HJP8_ROMCU
MATVRSSCQIRISKHINAENQRRAPENNTAGQGIPRTMDVDEIANELRSFGNAMFSHQTEIMKSPEKLAHASTESQENGQKTMETLPPIAETSSSTASEIKSRKPPIVKNTFSGGVRFFAPTENNIPLDYENDDSSPFEPNRPRFLINRSDRRIFLPDDHGERPYLIFGDIEDKINELQLNPEPSDIRYAIEMRNKQDKAYFKKIASDPNFTPPAASFSRKSQNTAVRYDNDIDYTLPSSSKKTDTIRDVDRFTAKNAMRKKIGLPTPKVNVSMMVDSSSAATIKRPVLAEAPDFEPKRLSAEEQLKIDAGSLISEEQGFSRSGPINISIRVYKIRFMDGEFRDMNQNDFVPLFKLKPGDELVISVTSKRDMYQFIPCRITKVPSKKIAKEWFEGMFHVENRASSNEERVPWTKLVIESRLVKNFVNIKRTAMASSLEGPKRTNIPPHQVLRPPQQRPPSLTAEGRLSVADNNKTEAMLVVKPFQQIDRTIFKGMRFVLTSATRPKDSQSSTDDAVIPPIMPFVKRRVREMIEERQGEVYDDFHQMEGEDTSNCYLVADQFYRTHKYLSALVRAVPCVSHMWIFECCKENQFLHPTIFMLPAGRSLENNQVMKW